MGEGCYHGDGTVEECYHGGGGKYRGKEGSYYGDSRVGKRVVTIATLQWGTWMLPWRQHNGGKGFYHGDSTMGEWGIAMETAQ